MTQRKEDSNTKLIKKESKSLLNGRKAEGYIDTAIKLIIGVVVGSLLLAGLYAIINNTVLPGLADRIQSMF